MNELLTLIMQYWVLPTIVLFVEYIVVMTVFIAHKDNPWIRYTVGTAFVIQDWIVNLLYIPLFVDMPKVPFELVTGRMQRYVNTYTYAEYYNYSWIVKWRLNYAYWLAYKLNRYDPGHITFTKADGD